MCIYSDKRITSAEIKAITYKINNKKKRKCKKNFINYAKEQNKRKKYTKKEKKCFFTGQPHDFLI